MKTFSQATTLQMQPALPEHDYVSPGLEVVKPDFAFPNMIIGDTSVPRWPWLRRRIEQNWYTDRRYPSVGFATRDEAAILYNSALLFRSEPCLEIGCWRGWSAVHLALGAGYLDIIDPIFSDPEITADIKKAFEATGTLEKISLHEGFSPGAMDRLAQETGRRWSLIFIDGDHEGEAPRRDAEAAIRYAADTAMVLFHDLASPYVAAGLDVMREAGWNTMVYQTMQIMGVAWRGAVEPVRHIPDPGTFWTLPSHLTGYKVSGWEPPETSGAGAWLPGMTLRDRYDAAMVRAQAIEDDFAAVVISRDADAARIRPLETKLDELTNALNAREAWIQDQRRELEDKNAKLKRLEDEEIVNRRRHTEAVEKMTKAFKIRVENAEAERDAALSRLEYLELSTSWRALAPLRSWLGGHPRMRRWGRRGAKLLWWIFTFKLYRKLRERRSVQQRLHSATHFLPEHPPQFDLTRGVYDQVPSGSLPFLNALFVPEWHEKTGTPKEIFENYLRNGLAADVSPGPLFNVELYRRRAAEDGLPALVPGESAVIHWLVHGQNARIVPTERFNEAFYRKANPDIDASPLWGFAHFIQYGLFEGRLPDKDARTFYRPQRGLGQSEQLSARLYRRWLAQDFPDRVLSSSADVPTTYERRLDEVLQSDWLAQIFSDAQAIDPDVGELSYITDILLPPLQDEVSAAHAELRRRLPATHYDSIICVPWIRTGGADLVAGLLVKALLRIRPDEQVLILRTDNPDFERANWLPDEADCVDISDLMKVLAPANAESLLRAVFRGLTAKRVFNVNSRLCWTTLQKHGANLAATLATYSYLFCWDQTASGLRAGYPAAFFAGTVGSITAFLTDTSYLRDELIKMYQLPPPVRARIVPLFTPAQRSLLAPSIARVVCNNASSGSRRLVLWAGRLDRQKRFDLVQEIARQMPDVEFRCWGSALLDAPPDMTALPANIHMQGSFDSFDDLPLAQAGAWLYTALWEGMPTTLIELATRGVAVVASAVGGVPELIQDDTGWPIPAEADAAVYVSALREVLTSPETAMHRAERLQRLVASVYTEAVYDTALMTLLDAESPR